MRLICRLRPSCSTIPSSVRSAAVPSTRTSAPDDHKAYYPGSHPLTRRITGDRATGRLLGAQLVGHLTTETAKRVPDALKGNEDPR